MIPTLFVVVDKLPLTINGKVNKTALMENHPLETNKHAIKIAYSSTESLLVEILKKVLKIPQVSIDDNFFLLGGDSIIAMQIVAKANQVGLQLAAQDIFQYPIVRDLAGRVAEKIVEQKELIQANKKFSLAPIQAWFFDQFLAKKEQFSQVGLLTLYGPIEVERLERCFNVLLERHQALNLRFSFSQGTWQQVL